MYSLKSTKDGFHFYYCDTLEDKDKLPTNTKPDEKGIKAPAHSEAFVIEDSSGWVLRGDTDELTEI